MGVLLHYHKMDRDKIRYLKSNMLTASITVRMWSSVRSSHCCWGKWCERVQTLYKTPFKKKKKEKKTLNTILPHSLATIILLRVTQMSLKLIFRQRTSQIHKSFTHYDQEE